MAKSGAARIPPEDAPARPVRRTTQDQPDQLIHERMRLGIISALAVNEKLSFVELKKLLNSTDGNVSIHARKLEDAGYVSCNKTFEDRVPRTEYRLTVAGRKALDKYLAHMEALIHATRRK
ncbi:MAG TPA: transcriptional regulator [Bryobacteraceae bacterium]|nr:transcriptional regulator [Bryobacteraceae bacterium]